MKVDLQHCLPAEESLKVYFVVYTAEPSSGTQQLTNIILKPVPTHLPYPMGVA
jgi:hypothetical protein